MREAAVVEDSEEAAGLADQIAQGGPALPGGETGQGRDVVGQLPRVEDFFGEQVALAGHAEAAAVPYRQRPRRRQAAQAQPVSHDVRSAGPAADGTTTPTGPSSA